MSRLLKPKVSKQITIMRLGHICLSRILNNSARALFFETGNFLCPQARESGTTRAAVRASDSSFGEVDGVCLCKTKFGADCKSYCNLAVGKQ